MLLAAVEPDWRMEGVLVKAYRWEAAELNYAPQGGEGSTVV